MSQAPTEARPAPKTLPRPIRRALGRLDRRFRLAGACRGLGTAALVVAAGAAVGMAADLAWELPQAARWAIWGTWLVSVVGLLVAAFRPLVRRSGAMALAALAERSHPHLGERLTAAVALFDERERRRQPPHGSPALIAALADEAAACVRAIDPGRAIPMGAAWHRLALGVVASMLIAAPAVIWPDPFGTLARRFLVPWDDSERVGRFVVSVTPGDHTSARGSDLTVSARIRSRFGAGSVPRTAWLEWTEEKGGTRRRMAMSAAPTGQGPSRAFAIRLPGLSGSLTYRVVGESAVSRGYRVTVVEPPAVAALAARIVPPPYSGLPTGKARDPDRIEALEGSRITLEVATTLPVRTIEVEWPGTPRPVAIPPGSEGKTGSVTLAADVSGPYRIRLRDGRGLTSLAGPPRRVVVVTDSPPTLSVSGNEAMEESRPDDVLRLGISARDDLAVASAELHHAIERAHPSPGGPKAEEGHVDLSLPGLGARSASGAAMLDLKTLSLSPGDVLSYRVRVADNRPPPLGPNVAWSPPRTLTIVAQAESMQARRGQAEHAEAQAKLDALKEAAAANRKETEGLRYAADAASRGNGVWDEARRQALADRATEARSVVDRLHGLARDLDRASRFRPLAPPARRAAAAEAENGRVALDRARGHEDPAGRLAELRQADAQLAALANRLDDLQRQFDALAGRPEAADSPPADPGAGPVPGDLAGPSAGAGPGAADSGELPDLLRRRPGRAWGELPGHLRTEILQMTRGRYRDDYERLIQLYFREIAAEAVPESSGRDRSP